MADQDPHAPPTPGGLPELDGLDALIDARLTWLRGDGDGRYLPADHERAAFQLAVDQGFGEDVARKAIVRWLRGRSMVREETLRTQVTRMLTTGHRHGPWVPEGTVDDAEQALVNHGMPPEQAAVLVAHLLEEQGLRDEREVLARCQPAFEAFVDRHCARGSYRPRQLQRLVDELCEQGVPRQLVERRARAFLGARGIEARRGLL